MIQIADLHVRYQGDRGEVHAVRGINLQIKEGQFYTLLGPSGCGKTSTLRCLAGLEPASGGEIKVMAGRYGPYVSDGTTHATLPKGADPKAVTLDDAVRLIDERAAKGPVKKKGGRKPTKRKAK